MSKQQHGISAEMVDSYLGQCNALAADWQRLGELLESQSAHRADQAALDGEFIALRSKLSCDYPILTYWRKGGYGLSAGIQQMLAIGPTLDSYAEAAQSPENPVARQWQAAQDSLRRVTDVLHDARRDLNAGKEVHLPPELLVHNTHVPFPLKKILKICGTVAAIMLLGITLYVMRNFLGFWAPGAGSGLTVTEGMTDAEQIEAVLVTMNEAFRTDDVDRFMTVIADDFKDEEGNGKTVLRVALQAFKERGEFAQASVNWSRMGISEVDGYLDVRPVFITSPDDEFSIHLGFKSYGGKLLIATGSAT